MHSSLVQKVGPGKDPAAVDLREGGVGLGGKGDLETNWGSQVGQLKGLGRRDRKARG